MPVQGCTLLYFLRSSIRSDTLTKLAQNRVHWRALVLRVLKLRVLLRGSYLISNMDFMELCIQDGRWMKLVQGRLQLRDLALKVLNLEVLVQKLWFVS